MYDDYDDQSRDRDGRDYYRRRSPIPRDHQYRSRQGKDASRSPRRSPSRVPRGDEPYRELDRGYPADGGYYDERPGYSGHADRDGGRSQPGDMYERDRGYHGSDDADDEYYNRRREWSPDRGRYKSYNELDAPRDRRRRGSRGPPSHEGSADADGYYRDRGPGQPYHTVKISDIPETVTTQELDDVVRGMGAAGLVEVRLKSDDRSTIRRCYAFAEFKTDDDAVDFLERQWPALKFNASDGSSVYAPLAYGRERRPQASADDWQCTLCHFENFTRRATCKQCKAPRSSENPADMQLDGKSDECPQQAASQFIVIRNLPASANEHVLATGMKKLYVTKDEPKQPSGTTKLKSTAPGNASGLGAKFGSLIRVFIIRDKRKGGSCRYGFAEFSNIDDARAAMAKYTASPDFTIGSKHVSLAYIHSGVFIPYFQPTGETDTTFTFQATHNPSLKLSYWNPSVYASEFTIFEEGLYDDKTTAKSAAEAANAPSGQDSKKRKADKELTAPTGKKTIAMAPQLAKWANKHAELHGAAAKKKDASAEKGIPATGSNSLGPSAALPATLPPANAVSYADLDRMCCLLCRCKFLSESSLRRHEQSSDMHKTNLGDEAKVDKATKDLKAVGKAPTSNYRDRARERRMVHSQPDKPKPHLPRKVKPSGAKSEVAAKDAAAPAKPTVSKGAGLLAKMGWSAGSGLGAEGGGRTNIIETTAYAPGVGLGAEGGKVGDAIEEAARATTNDYADFVSKAKEKARERYEKMGQQ